MYGPNENIVEYSWYLNRRDTCTVANQFIQNHEDSLHWYKDKYCRTKLVQYNAYLDDKGDTLYSEYFIDEEFRGIKGIVKQVIQEADAAPISIVTLWENYRMVDVLFENVIYVARGNKIISKENFLRKMSYFPSDPTIYPIYIPSDYWFGLKAEIILYTPRAAARLKTDEQVQLSVEKIIKKRVKQLK